MHANKNIRSKVRRAALRALGAFSVFAAFQLNAKADAPTGNTWTYSGTYASSSGTIKENVSSGTAWELTVTKTSKKLPLTITGITTVGASTVLDFTAITGSDRYQYAVATVNSGVFAGKTSIQYVIFSSDVALQGASGSGGAFNGCTGLIDIVWPAGCTVTVGRNALINCTSLTFPSHYDAESGWTDLTGLKDASGCQSGMRNIGLTGKVYMPDFKGSNSGHDNALAMGKVEELKMNITYGVIGNIFFGYNGDSSALKKLSGIHSCTLHYAALNYLTSLEDLTLGSDTLMPKMNIPDGKSSSGGLCGYGSSKNLERLYLGNNITNVGAYAFYDCTKLNYVRWPGQKPSVSSKDAFRNAGTASGTSGTSGTVLRQYFPYTNETWRTEITTKEKYTAWDKLDAEIQKRYTDNYGTGELPDGYFSEDVDPILRNGFVFFYGNTGPVPPPTVVKYVTLNFTCDTAKQTYVATTNAIPVAGRTVVSNAVVTVVATPRSGFEHVTAPAEWTKVGATIMRDYAASADPTEIAIPDPTEEPGGMVVVE